MKRARALEAPGLVPSNWKEASVSDAALAHREQYEAMVASARREVVASYRERILPPSKEELAERAAAIRGRILPG